MMLNDLIERADLPDGSSLQLSSEERVNAPLKTQGTDYLEEFRLEYGEPLWVFRFGTVVFEKRVLMVHRQNTVRVKKCSPVMECARRELLTPVSMRSPSPQDKNEKSKYFGSLRDRRAAYHQGTLWPRLIGLFTDARLQPHHHELQQAENFLSGFGHLLNSGAIGSISEIFGAEPPYVHRDREAQAWSVAEILRSHVKIATLNKHYEVNKVA